MLANVTTLALYVFQNIFHVCSCTLFFLALIFLVLYCPLLLFIATVLLKFLFFFRVVFLRLSSLAVLVTKVYIDVTCSPTDDCRIGTGVCKQIQVKIRQLLRRRRVFEKENVGDEYHYTLNCKNLEF